MISALGAAIGGAWDMANNGINQIYTKSNMREQNAFNAREAARAREFSHQEALLQREFEERMSSSAYQRAVSDMKASGLNPALLSSLSGASTPSGAAATGVAASGSPLGVSNSHSSAASVFNSLMNAAAKDKELAHDIAKASKDAQVDEARSNYYNSAAAYKNALTDYYQREARRLDKQNQDNDNEWNEIKKMFKRL